MTREEAIKILQGAIKKPNTKDGYLGQAIDMATKALEQEPILDKIRAEIDEVYEELDGYDPDSLGTFLARIDDIFDKYKAESERQEG